MTIDPIQGGCLCAAIRYRITGAPLALSLCHCRSCRLASGAPSVAWVVVRYADFSIESGHPNSFRSSPHVVRTFCGACGTPLTYQDDDSLDTIDVTTATLDHPERFPPTREIWIEHKVAWETLNPDLRHYPRSSKE
jgi:hypothetical protein